jgi:tetratricopeptide (TPR) repeat protein
VRWRWLVVGVAVAGIWPSPAAAALAPDAHGLIHACYGPRDGDELHLVAAGVRCPHGKEPIAWSARPSPGGSFLLSLGGNIYDGSRSMSVTNNASYSGGDSHHGGSSFWSRVEHAVPALGSLLLLIGLGLLTLSIVLIPVARLMALPRRFLWKFRGFRRLGPALQIEPFDDSALTTKLGAAFAGLTKARVGGGREGGMHLYLVTGEQSPGRALAPLQGVPQTQAIAAAMSVLTLTFRRTRLIVNGSLRPADDSGAVFVTLSLRRDSKVIRSTDLWLSQSYTANMPGDVSRRVMAVAAGGWVEHIVVDETPGPPAHEMFLSSDPRSWALFRAGAELSRISRLREAADHYERALAIDPKNVGALIDLAHLRRRDGTFEGAEMLARRAQRLVEERSSLYRRRDRHDANWYRARIVLATVHAGWAKALKELGGDENLERAEGYRGKALAQARDIALDARQAIEEIERAFTEGVRARVELGASVRPPARIRARIRLGAVRRRLHPGWAEQLIQLNELLVRSLEPAALLLVAGNCEQPSESPPEERDSQLGDEYAQLSREQRQEKLREARDTVSNQLTGEPTELKPRQLIEYVRHPPLKSSRVIYNLACYYGLAATPPDEASRETYLDIAAECLRQSIVRSPPLERPGLLDYAKRDSDLTVLREERRSNIEELWQLGRTMSLSSSTTEA